MAAAFSTFANKVVFCPATSVKSYSYADGGKVPVSKSYDPTSDSCRRVMSPHSASIVLRAMRANVSGEVADSFATTKNVAGHDNGGKSGTNQLYNSTWAHITGQYSVFVNVFDMDKLTNEVENVYYKGSLWNWTKNAASDTGANIMRIAVDGKPNIPLDFNSTDKVGAHVGVSDDGYVSMPSVVGMNPSQATQFLQSRGFKVFVNKERAAGSGIISSGNVVDQSVPAGSRVQIGGDTKIILTVKE